ncbi:MAG TPA: response regulator [Caulobacteraceae bacterium]|jgi:DNA-directed RNA polymerase specialized sigma24 family protein|nr:response regulator [Caulobacteraceae bacterium]
MPVRTVLRHAPYLRRYARALTGSQSEGDGFVRATLEGLIGSEQKLVGPLPMRVALFRAFHKTWRRALNGHSIDASSHGGSLMADKRLQRMTPEHRTAILLILMEGFSAAEASQILEVPEAEVQRRFEAAQRSIERQLATDVLIIEDETLIAQGLETLVSEMGHRVTGVASTKDQALALAERRAPGLVLADVRLADGSSGIEAAGDIQKTMDVPVIFITAFPERLLTGERPEPVFLVSKPFNDETVKALIGQALFFHQPRPKMALA